MSIDRTEFAEVLKDSYSAYYNITPREDSQLPLLFRADYFSRAEQYWLSKKITVWANETNEYAYIFSAPKFDTELADRCIDFALEEALPLVKPHKEHQFTNVKVLLLADSFDAETRKAVQKRKFTKSYNHSLHGFTNLHCAAVDMAEQKAYPNRAGHELAKYFSKLFAARNES